MHRVLLRPRWVGLALLVAAVCVAFVRLGLWQLDRLDQRHAHNRLVEANVDAPPAPVADVLGVGGRADRGDEWRPVRAVGRYDVTRQVLWRNRSHEGRAGYHAVVPLVTAGGTALLVDRGWAPSAGTADTRADVPAPPAGEVTVTGRVRLGEALADEAELGRSEVPQPSVDHLDPGRLAAGLPYPAYAGYVEVIGETPPPAQALVAVAPPTPGEGPHLAYALQWFLFAVVAAGGYGLLLWQERPGPPRARYGPRPAGDRGPPAQRGQGRSSP